MKKDVFYFSVGSQDGPHSAIWRLWWSKEGDVYLATRSLAGILKVSLHHTSNVRHIAFQKEFWGRFSIPKLGERTLYRWYRHCVLGTDISLECIIYAPLTDLRQYPIARKLTESNSITWIPSPKEGDSADIRFLLQDNDPGDHWPGQSTGAQLLKKVVMGNGNVLWLIHQYSQEKMPANYDDLASMKKLVAKRHGEIAGVRLMLMGEQELPHQQVKYMLDYAADRLLDPAL